MKQCHEKVEIKNEVFNGKIQQAVDAQVAAGNHTLLRLSRKGMCNHIKSFKFLKDHLRINRPMTKYKNPKPKHKLWITDILIVKMKIRRIKRA